MTTSPCILIPAAALLAACAGRSDAAGEAAARIRLQVDFEQPSEAGGLPPGWTPAETNGRGTAATWGRCPGHDSARGFGVLRSPNSGSTFNLAVLDRVRVTDFDAQLRIHAHTGQEDQGGGLCFRLRDPNNYYVVRWNPLETNLRLYTVVGGKRTQIAGTSCDADPAEWHDLAVAMHGDAIRVAVDGQVLIEHADRTFRDAGMFALWTKADAATWFDDLRVR